MTTTLTAERLTDAYVAARRTHRFVRLHVADDATYARALELFEKDDKRGIAAIVVDTSLKSGGWKLVGQ